MKNNLTCEIVRDLLPSYVDGLTNDVSNQAVEQHMKTCENCRKLYHEMQETVNGDEVSEINNEQKANFKVPSEIDSKEKQDADSGSGTDRCDCSRRRNLVQGIYHWAEGGAGRVCAGRCGNERS